MSDCDYTIKNPHCPQCGQLARGTLEEVQGVALLNIDLETGKADYAGETDVNWDSQTTVDDSEGTPFLVCPEGHQWPMEENPPAP